MTIRSLYKRIIQMPAHFKRFTNNSNELSKFLAEQIRTFYISFYCLRIRTPAETRRSGHLLTYDESGDLWRQNNKLIVIKLVDAQPQPIMMC